MKFLKLVFATALYLALLCSVWLLVVNFFKVNVVFYAAIWTALIAVGLQTALVLFSPLLRGRTWCVPRETVFVSTSAGAAAVSRESVLFTVSSRRASRTSQSARVYR